MPGRPARGRGRRRAARGTGALPRSVIRGSLRPRTPACASTSSQREQRLPGTPEEVFAFFADALNLEAITPPLLRFEVVTPRPIAMRVGTLIQYRLRLHGVPVIGWLTSIQEWDRPPHRFVDVQVRGPYALWHHTHTFEPLGERRDADARHRALRDRLRPARRAGPPARRGARPRSRSSTSARRQVARRLARGPARRARLARRSSQRTSSCRGSELDRAQTAVVPRSLRPNIMSVGLQGTTPHNRDTRGRRRRITGIASRAHVLHSRSHREGIASANGALVARRARRVQHSDAWGRVPAPRRWQPLPRCTRKARAAAAVARKAMRANGGRRRADEPRAAAAALPTRTRVTAPDAALALRGGREPVEDEVDAGQVAR